jgi:LPS export ABC transporter protein LptC
MKISIKRYSRFVLASKKLCTFFTLLIILTLIAIPLLNSKRNQLELSTKKDEITDNNLSYFKTKMVNPKFYGVNVNQEYNLSAINATEINKNQVILDQPSADIILNNKSILKLHSQLGLWEQINKILKIDGSVEMLYDDYRATTNSALFDMLKNTITSTDQILIDGPLGTIAATGFTALPKEQKIVFDGPVKVILFN